MSNYYSYYSSGEGGNPRFNGQQRGQQFNPRNVHPIQAVNSGNLGGGINGNVANDDSYGRISSMPPLPPGGTYNPNGIPLQRYNKEQGIYSKQHFFQNRQGLGMEKVVGNPERLEDYYSQNEKLSIIQEPDIKYIHKERFLTVSSKDRNLTLFPQPQNYVVHLKPTSDSNVASAAVGESYRNVVSVELLGGVIPDQGSVTDEPYLLLQIAELQNTFEGTNRDIKNAFAVLQLDSPVKSGSFINLNDSLYKNSKKIFDPPLAELSRLTIRITDSDGTDFNFGDDTGGTPPNSQFQHLLQFRIVERVVDTKQMQSRALFN